MRVLLATVLLITFGLSSLSGATPTRREALAAISTLERNLLSPEGLEAARVVTQFVEESEDVMCMLSPDTVPWMGDGDASEENADPIASLLFAVYLAGNTKAQLAAKKAEDDPYSGWVAALRAYRQIKTRRPISLPGLDLLSVMEKNGTLKRHAAEVKAKGEEAAPDSDEPADPTPAPKLKPSAPRKRDPSLIE